MFAKVGKFGERGKENRREDTRKEQTVQTHRRQQGKGSRRAHHSRHQRGYAVCNRRKAFPSGLVPQDKGIHVEHTAVA